MTREFKLPDLGEGIHEGEVQAVKVAVGDAVTEGDIILSVETDKAAVDIPSPFTATVAIVHVAPGDVVAVGQVMITFSGDKAPAIDKPASAAPPAVKSIAAAPGASSAHRRGPVPASPATRRLARALGVDLSQVTPTGTAGLVTADDVKNHAEKGPQTTAPPAAAAAPPVQPSATGGPQLPLPRPMDVSAPELPDFSRWGPTERLPVRGIRRATARRMSLAWQQIPHVTSLHSADITLLETFRNKHKAAVAAQGGKLSLTVFALKAAAAALKRFPNVNASLDTAAGEIIRKHYFHVGVAVDTEEGLVVPVVRDVDRKSITELAVELSDIVGRSRQRQIAREEMQGGSFTITNMGPLGGGHATPIINFPEVAIMGMGAAKLTPVVVEKTPGRQEFTARLILPLSLTFDHRVLDGADGARFMNAVVRMLEDPEVLLMSMT